MAVVSFVPTVVNAVEMAVARVVMVATAPKAIIAATRAYSIRSWPDSSLRKLQNTELIFLIVFVMMFLLLDCL